MGVKYSFLIMLLFSCHLYAGDTKPFIFGTPTSTTADQNIINQQICVIKNNLPRHLNYIITHILPRAEVESHHFTLPNQIDGKTFYVADNLDYTDLYHFHLRYTASSLLSQMDDFEDSNNYHLQYHSFEKPKLFQRKWLEELKKCVLTTEHQKWVDALLSENINGGSGSGISGESSTKLPVLSETSLTNLAHLWYQFLGPQVQSESRLLSRLKIMNDIHNSQEDYKALMGYRSVASFDTQFVILPVLNLEDSWQPVDVFFEAANRNQNIVQEIKDYLKRRKTLWLGNPDGIYKASLALDSDTEPDARQTFKRILQLAANSSDPLNVFKNIKSYEPSIAAITIVGENVYALRYNLKYDCH